MIQKECYRHLVTGQVDTYMQAVRVFSQEYGVELPAHTRRTAQLQGIRMKQSFDVAHNHRHLLDLTRISELLVQQRPDYLRIVDWSQLFNFISLHDAARAAIPVTPITLFSAQLMEYAIAPIVARRHMEKHWTGQKIDEPLLGIIERHPYHAGHPTRRGKVFSVTEQFAVDVDGLSVLSPERVDMIYPHIQRAFFGMPLTPFHGFLSKLFDTYASFEFFTPEAKRIAGLWRPETERYIKEKFLRRGKLS